MGKILKIPLDDETVYALNSDQIVGTYVASATTFNVSVSNSSTPIVFVHESDTRHLVFSSFLAALELCNSPKQGPDPSVLMAVPSGYNIEIG